MLAHLYLASKIERINESPIKYIRNSPSSSFVLSPVRASKVSELFSNLNTNKASINIPNTLIKWLRNNFQYLSLISIINNLKRVLYQMFWYRCTDPFNYRPIPILSPFSKILEKLMYEQLVSFIEKYKIFYEYKFGFRKGYSTEQAILEITDNLRNYLDNNQIVCGLFLNLSKAFDTVNHDILLAKMDKYGIRGEPLTWFKNYSQYVKIGCTESELLEMTCGIPQGSTLGPLHFLLYTNDMPNCAKKLSFRIFADDTNVFYSCKNLSKLKSTMNEQFKLIRNYCAINKLSINFQKTHYMVIFSTRKKLKDIKISNIEQ